MFYFVGVVGMIRYKILFFLLLWCFFVGKKWIWEWSEINNKGRDLINSFEIFVGFLWGVFVFFFEIEKMVL